MKYVDNRPPKLCHARPGDVIRMGDTTVSGHPTGEGESQLYLVCRHDVGKQKMREVSHGLYDESNPIFLVNLTTGEARPMPHLSSRVEIVRDVQVVEGEVDPVKLESEATALSHKLVVALKLGTPDNAIDKLMKVAQYALRGTVEGREVKAIACNIARALVK